MKLSREEELVALGAALYLLGCEVEASKDKLGELVEKGYSFASQEIAEEHAEFARLSKKFKRIEARYLNLRDE